MTRRTAVVAAIAIFAVLWLALVRQDPPETEGFDQPFYFSIAHDLDRYGVFSNGVFGPPGSADAPPPAGMYFMPLYPTLVWVGMQLDSRFAATIACGNTIRIDRSGHKPCTPYTQPMMIIHALLLTIGVMAVGAAGALLIEHRWAFLATAVIATLGAYSHAGLFIYMMTESLSFCLYGLTALAFLLALKRRSTTYFALTGVMAGLLVLARPSFLALGPIFALLFLLQRWPFRLPSIPLRRIAVFAVCLWATIAPWQLRNYVSLGKFGLSEEYGAQQIVERFGYNKMTLTEGLVAFAAGLPQIGPTMASALFGPESIRRFGWDEPDGFYQSGMRMRWELVQKYGRVDSVISSIVAEELRENWWRHILTTLPIAWCGLWVGQLWGLLLIPVFAGVTASALRRHRPLFVLYAAPALAMGLVHGLVGNHNVRYNLGFIGPISVAAAYVLLVAISRARARNRAENRRVEFVRA